MGNLFNPMAQYAGAFSVQYVSGSIWMSVRSVNDAHFEMANTSKPTVVMTVDPSMIVALTAALSAALLESEG